RRHTTSAVRAPVDDLDSNGKSVFTFQEQATIYHLITSLKLGLFKMSNQEVPKSLSDWLGVTGHDGFLVTENVTDAQFLTGRAFLSTHSLPDIQPNTKIVGICGIGDWNEENNPTMPGSAAPSQDGVFLSDFYMLHYLLKDVASDQVWLTCVSPESAVSKYGEYVHGDSRPNEIGSRRVVLDESLLDGLNDVQTVSPGDLLEGVLAAIKIACIEATAENRPVLILVFSQGMQPSHSIIMGGENAHSPKLLSKDSFKQAIGPRAPEAGLCLLVTESYGGGWAINPDLNVAPIASQGKYLETLAWPISGAILQRPCGVQYSSEIAETLLKLTVEGYETRENDGTDRGPFYAKVISLVEDAVQKIDSWKEVLATGNVHPMFSAHDEWEMEYSKRTGIPLHWFQERWLMLKTGGPRREASEGELRFSPDGRIYNVDQLSVALKREGRVYLDSYPGNDCRAKNVSLRNSINRVIGTRWRYTPSVRELGYLRDQVDYRLNQIFGTATLYKNFLGLDMPDSHETDADWVGSREGIRELLFQYYLFDEPCLQGHEYSEGEKYLNGCINKLNWDVSEATANLDTLTKFRVPNVIGSGIPTVPGASRIMETMNRLQLHRDRTIRDALGAFAQSTNCRLRSLSPNTSRWKPLQDNWAEEDAIAGIGKLSMEGESSL
ncbi:hypothetical protein V500_10832, partial [Pseudogymnoascus sp. VKM F-4518 (FW-2643)]